MVKQDILNKLGELLKEAFNKLQDRPNQYVVAYFKKKDDTLIGYHASTFCQITDDILKSKRYAGEDPYKQLATIGKNIAYTLDNEHEGIFADISNNIKNSDFNSLKSNEIYMDAIYLAEGIEKQECRYQIINGGSEISKIENNIVVDIDKNLN